MLTKMGGLRLFCSPIIKTPLQSAESRTKPAVFPLEKIPFKEVSCQMNWNFCLWRSENLPVGVKSPYLTLKESYYVAISRCFHLGGRGLTLSTPSAEGGFFMGFICWWWDVRRDFLMARPLKTFQHFFFLGRQKVKNETDKVQFLCPLTLLVDIGCVKGLERNIPRLVFFFFWFWLIRTNYLNNWIDGSIFRSLIHLSLELIRTLMECFRDFKLWMTWDHLGKWWMVSDPPPPSLSRTQKE